MSELNPMYELAGVRIIVDGIKDRLLSKLYFSLPEEKQKEIMSELFKEMKTTDEYKRVSDVIVQHYEYNLRAYFSNTRRKCDFCKDCECTAESKE